MAWRSWQDYMDARDDYGTTRTDNGGERRDARPWLVPTSAPQALTPHGTYRREPGEAVIER